LIRGEAWEKADELFKKMNEPQAFAIVSGIIEKMDL
jgi:hypothetical protein